MPAPCFHWHSNARAFAAGQEVRAQTGTPHSYIPADPPAVALGELHRILGTGAPFCVGDATPQRLDQLAHGSFATLTGGTSGRPKVIQRSQSSWIASFRSNSKLFSYTPRDSIAVLGALSHSLALYGVLEGLHLGLDVHALAPLRPVAQIARIHKAGCTILYATPTQLRLLPAGTPLPDIRLVLCGGGALSADTRGHIAAICPDARLLVFYGAAETSFVTMGDAETPEGSVGRAYDGVEIMVRDRDETGTGLIWLRSPYIFECYLEGDSPHTQRDGDWITVGEYGRLDAQGYLFLRGRAGRAINIADTTVFPEELEAQLGGLEGVQQCTVIARPDALRGHHLIAVVQGTPDKALRLRLLAHCKDNRLAPLREVLFLDPFPLLPSGKPDLPRIAALTGCSA